MLLPFSLLAILALGYVLWGGQRVLLSVEQLRSLKFPVVIRSDDCALYFFRTAEDVFNKFEPQDLEDESTFGWDSAGRRFCFGRWERDGAFDLVEFSSWDEFDRCLEQAYHVDPEVGAWRTGEHR